MIVGSLKNTARIEQMHPRFKAFFDFVKNNDWQNLELGKIELDGDNLFVNNVVLDPKTKEEAKLEGHKEYIDIQLLLKGDEQLGWKPLEDAEKISQPYDEGKDLIFFDEQCDDYVSLKPGQFAVFFPEDLHAPGISDGKIYKFIAKVKEASPCSSQGGK